MRSTLTRPDRQAEFKRRLHAAQELRRPALIQRRRDNFWPLVGALAVLPVLYTLYLGIWAVAG